MKKLIPLSKRQLIFYALLLSVSLGVAQTIHTVNNNPGVSTDFTDLQDAINGAASGDILYVQQSATSYGTININKPLTIIGRSHSDNSYRTIVDQITFDAGSSNTTIKGMNTGYIGEFNSGATITALEFFDNDIRGIGIGNAHTFNNILFQGNVIREFIFIFNNVSNILIANNIIPATSIQFNITNTLLFTNNVMTYFGGPGISNNSTDLLNITNCIFVGNYPSFAATVTLSPGSGTIQVDNCLTYNYDAGGTYNFATGAGITINGNVQENVDPLFTNVDVVNPPSIASPFNNGYDPLNDDLTLQGGSTVTDDGLFQGYNFKYLGTPTGLPSVKIDSYSPTIPKNSTLSVTIKAKTN